jgi:hypothetical protein
MVHGRSVHHVRYSERGDLRATIFLGPTEVESLSGSARDSHPDRDGCDRSRVFDVVIVETGDPGREITLAQVEASGVALATSVDDAMRQTWREELVGLDVRDHEFPDQRTVRVLAIEGNAYVTLALLALARYIEGPAEAGAFITAPTFDTVALYPLTTREDTEVLAGLARVSANIAAGANDVCDPRVHWWDGKTFHEIDLVGVENRTPVIAGPEPLLAALDSLNSRS